MISVQTGTSESEHWMRKVNKKEMEQRDCWIVWPLTQRLNHCLCRVFHTRWRPQTLDWLHSSFLCLVFFLLCFLLTPLPRACLSFPFATASSFEGRRFPLGLRCSRSLSIRFWPSSEWVYTGFRAVLELFQSSFRAVQKLFQVSFRADSKLLQSSVSELF